jgi:serine/threonine protein kinase/Tfp pilus assembly protein PilF
VAVKVIKEGMDSRQVLARFEAERQALALMEHPHIARVFDAGKTPSGRPYFVMELVKGRPITNYCDEERLGVRERLVLFGDVCRAVQHAHQKGIIHRDLKPSNVLVAPYDGQPVVKVIDFGVAKATGQRLTDRTLFTGFGALMGTPEYMSPEQAEVNNQDIDTRSDIYSLGVLLYELLTGSTPLTRKRIKEAALLEVLRVIREEEPPRPSTRLSESKDTLPSISAQRQTEPARLMKLVRGELDWIVMKALEKDRNRRYETANGFAMDVQRYLADEPVLACPPSLAYRLRKLVRRHRGPVLAAALLVLVLLMGIIGTTLGLVRAALAAEVARKRLAQVENANEILSSIFSDLDPSLEEKEGIPLRVQLAGRLDKAAKLLESETVGDPLMTARLQSTLGRSYTELGYPDKGIVLLNRARTTYEVMRGPDDPVTLTIVHNLAAGYWQAGKLAKALPLLERTLEKRKAALGPDHPDTLESMNGLAVAYLAAGELARALPLLEQTLEKSKAVLGPDHPDTLASMNNLAHAYKTDRQLGKALPLFEQTLEKRKSNLAPDHPHTLHTMGNLALAYEAAGQPAKAVPLHEQTLEKMKAKLGPDHPDTLLAMLNLSHAYSEAGQPAKALALSEQTLEKTKAKLGPHHLHTLRSMNSVAGGYWSAKQLDRSVPLFEETLKLFESKLGPNHPETLLTMANLAVNYRDAGRVPEAIPLLEEALKRAGKRPADILAWVPGELAFTYDRAGQSAKAETLYRDALEQAKKQFGEDDLRTCAALAELGLNLLGQKKYADAEPLLRACLKTREKKQPDDWTTFNTRSLLGASLLGQTN